MRHYFALFRRKRNPVAAVPAFLLACCIFSGACSEKVQKVADEIAPLPPGAVRLTGYLENDIQNSNEN